MTLYTGCLYTNSHRGSRISVVSPSPPWTPWNDAPPGDGTALPSQISTDSFDEWWMELSPPPRLVAEFYYHALPWKKFRKEYLHYLHQTTARHVLRHLTRWALQEDFTLLCVEPTPAYCHRRILAEESVRREPNLEVVVR